MKVLWFTNTPSLYDQGNHHYQGGGWIHSLERLIDNDGEIELAVAFFHPTDSQKVKRNNTTYFPIKQSRGKKKPFRHLVKSWCGNLLDNNFDDVFESIVDDFIPEIIQIFGSEWPFATIHELMNISFVLHLQSHIHPFEMLAGKYFKEKGKN